MAHFAYIGLDAKGRTVRGTVDADDVKGVRQSLRKLPERLGFVKARDDDRQRLR